MSANVRMLALDSLIRCEKEKRYSNIEVDTVIRKNELDGVDRSFYTNLVYGVYERMITLDYVINSYSSILTEKMDPAVRNILRLGAYQILFLDRTPDSAAVNESVNCIKERCKRSASGFVNAVLRTISSKGMVYPSKDDFVSYASVRYSVSEWIVKKWLECYGKEKTEKILDEVNTNPDITLRVNSLKTSRENLIKKLSELGVESEPDKELESVLYVKGKTPVGMLLIDEGLCYVQDRASQKSMSVLGASPGDTVIDCCSCPGGKSFFVAIEMENKGKLYSFDLHENKLSLVKAGGEKLGIDIIETAAVNGTRPREDLFGKADRVICDVPCSGLGVIRKKPDLRYKSEEETGRLPDIQLEILSQSVKYLKCGGRIAYSTCTLNSDENEGVVKRFLESNYQYELLGEETILPSEKTDGFYYALIGKKET